MHYEFKQIVLLQMKNLKSTKSRTRKPVLIFQVQK